MAAGSQIGEGRQSWEGSPEKHGSTVTQSDTGHVAEGRVKPRETGLEVMGGVRADAHISGPVAEWLESPSPDSTL